MGASSGFLSTPILLRAIHGSLWPVGAGRVYRPGMPLRSSRSGGSSSNGALPRAQAFRRGPCRCPCGGAGGLYDLGMSGG